MNIDVELICTMPKTPSQLGARLVVDNAIDAGSNAFQRDLDPVTVLEPQSGLSAHADTLRPFRIVVSMIDQCADRVVLTCQ